MPDFERIADHILMARTRMNVPVDGEPGMRVVGWKVEADKVGMSDVFEALRIVERRADLGGDAAAKLERAEVDKALLRGALAKIVRLEDSEVGEPLDDAIRIARNAIIETA